MPWRALTERHGGRPYRGDRSDDGRTISLPVVAQDVAVGGVDGVLQRVWLDLVQVQQPHRAVEHRSRRAFPVRLAEVGDVGVAGEGDAAGLGPRNPDAG